MDKQSILQACTIEGNVVKLPPEQLDRKLYLEVAKSLELIGGKWNGHKVMGFVFPQDPTELLAEIAGGAKRNLKKEFQFFGTPQGLAADLVRRADIGPADEVCEPSAGQGAIVKEIIKVRRPGAIVFGYELMDVNRIFLSKIPEFHLLGEDFLKDEIVSSFDKIIANPPFAKNQDIDHIYQMYSACRKGGRIVTMSSPHWQIGQEKKCKQFRQWLDEVGAFVEPVKGGAFDESGTSISTRIIEINK